VAAGSILCTESSTSGTVGITVETPDGQRSYSLSFSENCLNVTGHLIHVFAAKSLLNDFEDQYEEAVDDSSKKTIKERAITLSKLFSVSCRWTSFVGIENRQDPVLGSMETIEVPMLIVKDSILKRETSAYLSKPRRLARFSPALAPLQSAHFSAGFAEREGMTQICAPATFRGSANFCGSSPKRKYCGSATAVKRMCADAAGPKITNSHGLARLPAIGAAFTHSASTSRRSSVESMALGPTCMYNAKESHPEATRDLSEYSSEEDENFQVSPTPLAKASLSASDVISTLASLQNACGSWFLTEQLASLLNKELSVLQAECGALGLQQDAFATALVICFLGKTLDNYKAEWNLYVTKARKWLDKTIGKDQTLSIIEQMS